MKKEELTTLGLTDEQADKVLAMNGRDIEKHKKAAEDATAKVTTLTQQLADRDKDLEDLKGKSSNAEEVQKELDKLKEKYATDTENYKKQIADREYADALTSEFAAGKVLFSSKAAEQSIRGALMKDRLTLKDGKLEGFSDRIKSLKDSDPDAFKSETPPPNFTTPVGAGGPPAGLSRAAQAARAAGSRFAPATAPANNNGGATT